MEDEQPYFPNSYASCAHKNVF